MGRLSNRKLFEVMEASERSVRSDPVSAYKSKPLVHRLSEQELTEITLAYFDGVAIRELAKRHHVTRSTISVAITKLGLPRQRLPLLQGYYLEKAKALRKAGWSYERIAKELGVSPNTVKNTISREV